jgi:hypothetical protein
MVSFKREIVNLRCSIGNFFLHFFDFFLLEDNYALLY